MTQPCLHIDNYQRGSGPDSGMRSPGSRPRPRTWSRWGRNSARGTPGCPWSCRGSSRSWPRPSPRWISSGGTTRRWGGRERGSRTASPTSTVTRPSRLQLRFTLNFWRVSQDTSFRHLTSQPPTLILICFSAHAEDAAIDDAVYFLGESLRRGVIDSELFLKHVRDLSRLSLWTRTTI